MRGVAFRMALKHSETPATEYDSLLRIYETAPLQEDRSRALSALGHAPTDELLLRTLRMGLEIRLQDAPIPFSNVASHKKGRYLAWAFLRDNFAAVQEKVGSVRNPAGYPHRHSSGCACAPPHGQWLTFGCGVVVVRVSF